MKITPVKPATRKISLNCSRGDTGNSNAVDMSMSPNHHSARQEGNISTRSPVCSSRSILLGICALLLSVCVASAQGTFQSLTVTFDGPPLQPPGSTYNTQSYREAGVWFAPIPGTDGFGRRGSNPPPGWPDNGTAYVLAGLGDSLVFGLDDGSDFGLVSVDLAEWSTAYPEAVTVPFVGYRRDGSTVTASFTTDGVMDGNGPLADFQTFYFGAEFVGVYRVRIPAYGWSLDNLVVSVPEPGTSTLLAIGAVLMALGSSKRKGQ